MSPGLRRGVQGLLGAAAMIAAITVLSRVLGFARVLVQAGTVGGDDISNAYNAANLLPNILFETAAGGALAGAVVPLLAAPVAAADREQVSRVASAVLGWTLLVLVPLGLLLAALAGPLAGWLGDGEPAKVAAVRFFLLVFSVQVPLYGLAVLLYAVLQSHRKFFWPAFAPVLNSLVVIVAYVVYGAMADGERSDPAALPAGALDVLAWGTTAGVLAMCVPVLGPVRRLGVRLRPTLRFPTDSGGRFRALALAGVGSVAAQQVSVAVVWWLANDRLPGGDQGFTTFLYAQQVYLLPYAVLVVPLATSTFPRVAAYASDRDRVRLAHLSAVTTRAVLAVGTLGAAAVLAGGPALAVVFAGIAGQSDPGGMTSALTAMAGGVVGLGVVFHVSRTLYAVERPRAAIAVSAVAWLAVAVATPVGVLTVAPGTAVFARLGLGTTVGMTLGGVVALVALVRVLGRPALAGLARTLVVVLAGAGAGAVLGRLVAVGVLEVVGDGWPTAAAAAAGGAVVAGGTVAVLVALLDRSTLVGVLRAESAHVPTR
ncbi:virulence factor MVIN family protein [Cellulomonas flavigena DSM 20109]|uniref:Virulence factor MVIN family protein n=1 Tax=Cellulomonas flavigena (strain ATCC 482 / DSM 20109 / BCRC 11376 / JCM 18109 / NBRC 3775 / NCIMB 8073 / NRS 134) TaxID=446466 RepID=D5UE02_CELFN|nr:virulence factor MVIN family protein [Cellulomonas flavigena DSM 20109]